MDAANLIECDRCGKLLPEEKLYVLNSAMYCESCMRDVAEKLD